METKRVRICMITTRNIFDAPCIAKYQILIDEPFDIIYWDRCNISEECGAENYYKYNGPLKMGAGKFEKISGYIGFARYVRQVLKKHTYDKLIIFPTQMGWLIQRELCHRYKGKYIFDIRDYAGEKNKFISYMTQKVITNAGICSITSPAYRKFLPAKNYIISHNVQMIEQNLIEKYREREQNLKKQIILSFIGSVRFIDQQKKLLLLFKNDERFHIKYIGRGSEQLKEFCTQNRIQNVTLIGRFDRIQLPEFYMQTDMAINVYGNNNPYLDYALSNKLYSAAMMGMPILVSSDTYMEEISKRYGFGCSVDLNDKKAPDKVFKYYKNINWERLLCSCDEFMKAVNRDEKKYGNAIKNFLGS